MAGPAPCLPACRSLPADYFSERVAFYFAFLAHYAMWLIVPALVGIGIFADQVRPGL